jgi:hypothetical protein
VRGGIDFDLPEGTMLPAGGTLVIVGFDPANATTAGRFRSAYGIGGGVTLAGPFVGRLANGGEAVRLLAPTDPPAGQTDPVHYLVDRVTYSDASPWPDDADGEGPALTRIAAANYGDAAASWQADDPSPGSVDFDEPPVLPGDYNGSGLVEQADLDLVLGNWGATAASVPATWVNDPPSGFVDQDELDAVLSNWGAQLPATAQAAPAPQQALQQQTGRLGPEPDRLTAKTPAPPTKRGDASDPCVVEASPAGVDLSKIGAHREEPGGNVKVVRPNAKDRALAAVALARDAALARWTTAARTARTADLSPLRERLEPSQSISADLAERLFAELWDDLLVD